MLSGGTVSGDLEPALVPEIAELTEVTVKLGEEALLKYDSLMSEVG